MTWITWEHFWFASAPFTNKCVLERWLLWAKVIFFCQEVQGGAPSPVTNGGVRGPYQAYLSYFTPVKPIYFPPIFCGGLFNHSIYNDGDGGAHLDFGEFFDRGLALVPSAWAGTGSGRPDFQLVRPSYMQAGLESKLNLWVSREGVMRWFGTWQKNAQKKTLKNYEKNHYFFNKHLTFLELLKSSRNMI